MFLRLQSTLQSHKSHVAEEIRNSAGGDCEATAMWSMGVAPKGKLKITNNLQPLQHFILLRRLLYFHEDDSKVILQREQPQSECILAGVASPKSGLLGHPHFNIIVNECNLIPLFDTSNHISLTDLIRAEIVTLPTVESQGAGKGPVRPQSARKRNTRRLFHCSSVVTLYGIRRSSPALVLAEFKG